MEAIIKKWGNSPALSPFRQVHSCRFEGVSGGLASGSERLAVRLSAFFLHLSVSGEPRGFGGPKILSRSSRPPSAFGGWTSSAAVRRREAPGAQE